MRFNSWKASPYLAVIMGLLLLLGVGMASVLAQENFSPSWYSRFGMQKPNIIPYVSSIAGKDNKVYLTYEHWNGTTSVTFLISIDPVTGHILENHTLDMGDYDYVSSITSYNNELYLLTENYTQVGDTQYTTEIILRVTSDYKLEKFFEFTWERSDIETFGFTYDGSNFWFITRNFQENNSYLCSVDTNGNVVKNITFVPSVPEEASFYMLLSVLYVRNSLLILDSNGLLFKYNYESDNVSRVFNVTESLEPLFLNQLGMDNLKPLSLATNDTYLWVAVDGIEVRGPGDIVFYHYLVAYNLIEIIPPTSESAPVIGGTLESASAGGVVSSVIAATAIVVGTASVVASASVGGATAGATAAGTTAAATGGSAAAATQAGAGQSDFIKQLKNLFSLRKLMGLLKRKKKKKKAETNVEVESVSEKEISQEIYEEQIKPNFSLGAGITALFGLIAGAILGLVANSSGGYNNILAIIGATVGFPLAIFGTITGGFILFLYINKELSLKRITLIILVISFVAALYGLYSSTFALFGYILGGAAVAYIAISVLFSLVVAGTQLYNFVSILPETR